jgi:hypothetical protein
MMVLGRHREALDDLRPAVTLLGRTGQPGLEARAHTFRALVYFRLGAPVPPECRAG